MLLWTLLIFFALHSLNNAVIHRLKVFSSPFGWLFILTLLFVGLVSAPLSGWLANAKFGNYKVFSVGATVLFIDTVVNCLLLTLDVLILESNHVLKWIHVVLSSLSVVGGCACVVTALPLGLDQMPDASSSNTASYIAWFVCSFYIGGFVGEGFHLFEKNCMNKEMHSSYALIWALLSVICMSIVQTSNYLFSPKWLIIEPKSPQSLKTIYHVLKFAAKHKAPINRSAFTYWEEDIPSRIDLGKSKYGGPFTTEEVEDVKTLLRLLAISLPFAVIIISYTTLLKNIVAVLNVGWSTCSMGVAYLFFSSYYWYSLLGIVVHEFLIYPFIRNRLPSILKRIGVVTLLTTFVTSICFTLTLAHYLSYSSETATNWSVLILNRLTGGALAQLVVTLILEFVCAQSPYNMRGLLLSSVVILGITSAGVQLMIGFNVTAEKCIQLWCIIVSYSVQLALCIIGFLLFCVVARWYKLRVRDDDYSPQRVVEEVYDRYLTAAALAEQSRSYGAAQQT